MSTERKNRIHKSRASRIREDYESLAVWTISEAAEYAFVTEQAIFKWIKEGKFPARPAGPGARVYAESFKRFVDTGKPQALPSLMQSTA